MSTSRARRSYAGRSTAAGITTHAVIVAVFAALLVAGCAKKSSVVEPPPVVPGALRVEGNRVLWSTDRAARATVRYSYTSGSWDHDAYPRAANREDRAAVRDHDVPLLDLRPGETLYYQAVSEVPGQPAVYSPVQSFTPSAASSRPLLTSTMIHIGFGDSHLLTMPNTRKRFLIDSGGRFADQSVITYLQQHNVTALDAMLATHVHEDHLGGVVGSSAPGAGGVLGAFPPAVFFDSSVKSTDSTGKPAYVELLSSLSPSTQRVMLSRGQSSGNTPELRLDPDVVIYVLNSGVPPGYQPVGYEGTNINNESIVLRFTYGDVDFIIGGDCENEAEAIIQAGFPPASLEVEFFKATHHGLPDANGASWVNILRPRIGFIPNTQAVWDPPQDFEGAIGSTVAKLQGIGAHVYVIDDARTLDRPRGSGRQYNVSFVTDGISYEVRVEQATQPTPSLTAQESGCIASDTAAHAHAPATGGH